MIRKLTTFIFAGLLITGCASTARMTPEASSSLKTGKVAAAVYVEGKRIKYDELVYKVLWNESRSQQATFEGMWDVDRDLSGTFSNSLRQIGLAAQPISNVLIQDKQYAAFEQAILNTRDADQMNAPLTLTDNTRMALTSAGIDHLVLVRAVHFQARKVSGFKPQFSLPSVLIVYDVKKGTQAYQGTLRMGGAIAVKDSAREVEANGLAKLKAASREWVKFATSKRIPTDLGLVR